MVHQQIHVIRNIANRSITQASYTEGRVQPAKKINRSGANCSNTWYHSHMAQREFKVILRTTTDEFNVLPRTHLCLAQIPAIVWHLFDRHWWNAKSFLYRHLHVCSLRSWNHHVLNNLRTLRNDASLRPRISVPQYFVCQSVDHLWKFVKSKTYIFPWWCLKCQCCRKFCILLP